MGWIAIFKKNIHFFLLFVVYVVLLGLLQVFYTKPQLFLAVNNVHSPGLDIFFRYYTELGHAGVYIAFIIALLFIRYRFAIIALASFAATTIVAQFLKRIVFISEPRPKKYFENIADIRFIENLEMHSMLSFPSGHTVSAFSLATLIALLLGNKKYGILIFLMALLAAYSRVYLSQHFVGDVYAGSIIGVCITVPCYYFLIGSKAKWMDRSILHER